jgi:microcystin-dependent protein
MSDPYIGEIRMVAFDFEPYDWAFCDGRLLPIVQYSALFAVISNYYGGDRKTTFALPNLQGRAPMHWGTGTSLTPRLFGETGGKSTVTLSDLPVHTHPALGASSSGPTSPAGATWGSLPGRSAPPAYFNGTQNVVTMNTQALGLTGGGQPHNNMQPYPAMHFVIALLGIYPSRD